MKAFEESELKSSKPKDPIMYAIHYEQVKILENIENQVKQLKSKANQIMPIEEEEVISGKLSNDGGSCIVDAFELITRKLNELSRDIVHINNHLDKIF